MVARPSLDLRYLRPLRRVSRDAPRKALLQQRRSEQMDRDSRPSLRIPDFPTLLLPRQ